MNVLNLSKSAGILDLSKAAPTLKHLRGVLNWDVHPVFTTNVKKGFDLDIFAIATKNGKVQDVPGDVAFFNNKSIHDGAVSVPHDNRTGEGDDDEEVVVQLDKVAADCTSIELFVIIHEAAERNQHFGAIQNGKFTLYNAQNNGVVQEYSLSQYDGYTSLHIGALNRNSNGWEFQPSGQGYKEDPNQVLGRFA